MKNLLNKLSDAAIQLGDVDFLLLENNRLGYAPASKEAVQELEKRLQINLPSDYKDFLLVTNGLQSPVSTEPNFVPADGVTYLKNSDPDIISIWRESGNASVADELEKSILVAGENEEQYFLLLPPEKPNSKWRYWKFAHWIPGEQAYASLKVYFKEIIDFINEELEDECEPNSKDLSLADLEEIEKIKAKIDLIQKQYAKEYESLASESEALYLQQKALERKYAELDKKTGLNSYFERLANIKENSS